LRRARCCSGSTRSRSTTSARRSASTPTRKAQSNPATSAATTSTCAGSRSGTSREFRGAYFITKRGEERPADKEAAKCIDSADYAKMVVSWMCQRPSLATDEKRLFDELYKLVFHPELDAQSMLALRLWLNEIDKHWPQLDINEAVKAVKGAARFHMLFIV